MKVQLTGNRAGDTLQLCGVNFVDGVGELNQNQVSAGVFDNLLARYYNVVEFKDKPKAPESKPKKSANKGKDNG